METLLVWLIYGLVFLLLSYITFNYALLKRRELIHRTAEQNPYPDLPDRYHHGVSRTQRLAIRRLMVRTSWPFVTTFLVWTVWLALSLTLGASTNAARLALVASLIGLGFSGLLDIRMQVLVHNLETTRPTPKRRKR